MTKGQDCKKEYGMRKTKYVVIMLLLVAFAFTLSAQNTNETDKTTNKEATSYRTDSSFKVFGGWVYSGLTNDFKDMGYENRSGFQIGVSYSLPIYTFRLGTDNLHLHYNQRMIEDGEFLLLEPGLRYIVKGNKAIDPHQSAQIGQQGVNRRNVTIDNTLSYIDLFCKLKYGNVNHWIQPYIGVSGAYLLTATESIKGGTIDIEADLEDMSSLDVDILLGLELIMSKLVVLDIEYSRGFINVDDKNRYIGKNSSLILSVGIRF